MTEEAIAYETSGPLKTEQMTFVHIKMSVQFQLKEYDPRGDWVNKVIMELKKERVTEQKTKYQWTEDTIYRGA